MAGTLRPTLNPKTQRGATYHVYVEMRRIADALFALADECRNDGDKEMALSCYKEAKELADVCVKLEKAPARWEPAKSVLDTLDRRLSLATLKKRQRDDRGNGTFAALLPERSDGNHPTAEERDPDDD